MVAKIQEVQHFSEAPYLRSLVPNWSKLCSKVLYLQWFLRLITLLISAKIQDGDRNSENSTFTRGIISEVSSTQRVQNLLKMAPSLTIFTINDIFCFHGNSKWRQKFGKFNFFTGTISKVSSIQRVQNLLKMAPSLTIFTINDIFRFHGNSKWRQKFGKFNFFTGTISKVSSIQRVQNLLEITVSLTISMIFVNYSC